MSEDAEKFVQWEYGIVLIPATADLVAALNKNGEDGWEPWAILGGVTVPNPSGIGEPVQCVQLGMKRHKRKITMSTDIMGALEGGKV